MTDKPIRAVVVGGTGYTGAELVRLALAHPSLEVTAIVGNTTAGEPVDRVLPSLQGVVNGPVQPFDPAAIARAYEQAGAQAVSVLMDHTYFGGGEDDFRSVRRAVRLPMLYKEFVVDAWQVWHARLTFSNGLRTQ